LLRVRDAVDYDDDDDDDEDNTLFLRSGIHFLAKIEL